MNDQGGQSMVKVSHLRQPGTTTPKFVPTVWFDRPEGVLLAHCVVVNPENSQICGKAVRARVSGALSGGGLREGGKWLAGAMVDTIGVDGTAPEEVAGQSTQT